MKNPIVRLPEPLARGFSVLNRVMVTASRGRLGSRFRSAPVILLTTTGRTTGKARTWPLVGLPVENELERGPDADEPDGRRGGWAVAASNGGHDEHPGWYLNLLANPRATVGDRGLVVEVHARDTTRPERNELLERFVLLYGGYADYEHATDRVIPVLMLEPVT